MTDSEDDSSLSKPEKPGPSDSLDESVEDIFGLIADETRFSIMEVLWRADEDFLSFSELRNEVGIKDSGKFNYHLGKLTGRFIMKTEEGYKLRYPGKKVIGAILSGSYSTADKIGPIEMDDGCPHCGEVLEMTYENERAEIACSDCEVTMTGFDVAPGITEGYSEEELPYVFGEWVNQTWLMTKAGFCLLCNGKTELSIEKESLPGPHEERIFSEYTCTRCDLNTKSLIGFDIIDHHEVVNFHYDHGIEVDEKMFWEIDWLNEKHAEIIDDDPTTILITIELDDEIMEVEAEAHHLLEITSLERKKLQ